VPHAHVRNLGLTTEARLHELCRPGTLGALAHIRPSRAQTLHVTLAKGVDLNQRGRTWRGTYDV